MCRKAWDGRRRDREWIDTGKLHQFRYVVNPCLRHLEAQGRSARSVQQSSLSSLLPAALISASGSARGAASWTACRLLSLHRCPWMRRFCGQGNGRRSGCRRAASRAACCRTGGSLRTEMLQACLGARNLFMSPHAGRTPEVLKEASLWALQYGWNSRSRRRRADDDRRRA